MPDITLTDAELQILSRCLSDRVEPPADLAAKLFPTLHTKFDQLGNELVGIRQPVPDELAFRVSLSGSHYAFLVQVEKSEERLVELPAAWAVHHGQDFVAL